jgi:hypothetical protein
LQGEGIPERGKASSKIQARNVFSVCRNSKEANIAMVKSIMRREDGDLRDKGLEGGPARSLRPL